MANGVFLSETQKHINVLNIFYSCQKTSLLLAMQRSMRFLPGEDDDDDEKDGCPECIIA